MHWSPASVQIESLQDRPDQYGDGNDFEPADPHIEYQHSLRSVGHIWPSDATAEADVALCAHHVENDVFERVSR